VQGPNVAAARRLANAIFPGITRYVSDLQRQTATKPAHRVTIRQLGPAQAGVVHARSRLTLMALASLGVLVLGTLLLLAVESLRRHARSERELAVDLAADLDRVAYEERTRAVV
jgi:hypothetical protein